MAAHVLFLCTGNSCRSQMAEGWGRALWGGRLQFYSAGLEAHGLNPMAVRVMAEAGVDISGQQSQTVVQLAHIAFDIVITVCSHADQHCPVFDGAARRIHAGFDDPPKLAAVELNDEDKLRHYRRVRDQIRRFVERLDTVLETPV